jgi:hypothetical protein
MARTGRFREGFVVPIDPAIFGMKFFREGVVARHH